MENMQALWYILRLHSAISTQKMHVRSKDSLRYRNLGYSLTGATSIQPSHSLANQTSTICMCFAAL